LAITEKANRISNGRRIQGSLSQKLIVRIVFDLNNGHGVEFVGYFHLIGLERRYGGKRSVKVLVYCTGSVPVRGLFCQGPASLQG
jgi:hypothetical protein